jgi:hypothetical protein
MNKILISLMIIVLFVVVVGCSGGVKENNRDDANTGDIVNDSDTGNTGQEFCDESKENEKRMVDCGHNGNGEQEQICKTGTWIDFGDCDDPDECKNGEIQEMEYCGYNGYGIRERECIAGKWGASECIDPDECTNSRKKIIICLDDAEKFQDQICFDGKWVDYGECHNTLCPDSNKFCHFYGGLNWSDASINDMNLDDAASYCQNLGGRLPSISQLRALIQNCPYTETGGSCNIADDGCLDWSCRDDDCWGCSFDGYGKYSVFGDTYMFWSSSESLDNAGYAGTWYVYFSLGSVGSIHKTSLEKCDVRCVK